MAKRLTLILLLCVCSTSLAVPPVLPGWDISWFDEFDGNNLDQTKWTPIFSTNPTNNSLHAYLPSMVGVSNGNLVINSDNIPFQGLNYRSGQVISKNEQQYGKWEVRAQLPTSKGQWPAIWLLPKTGTYPWPSQGEIDIMENRGDQPNLTSSAFHWGTNPPFSHQFVYSEQAATIEGQATDYHNSFHTYGVEWTPEVLRFFVDGVNHYNVHDEDTGGFLSSQTARMETVINNAIGGNFLENPDNTSAWPQQMLIDYVHVYSPGTPVDLVHENGSFDGGPSPLAGWSTFGVQNFGNVTPHNEAVLSGSHSLKLFGQFNGQVNYSGVQQGITVSPGDDVRAMVQSLIRGADSIAGTDNEVVLNIDYYSQRHGKYGSSDYISTDSIVVADGSTLNNIWLQSELRSTAPAGAVEARMALVFIQPNGENGAVHLDNTVFGRRGDNVLIWDGTGDGTWNTPRWNGVGPTVPTDFDTAIIRNNNVTVAGTRAAHQTLVESGQLSIANTLSSNAMVESGGAIRNSGTLNGDLDLAGSVVVEGVSALQVNGDVDLMGAAVSLDDGFDESRGTYTGEFAAIDADSLVGTLATSAGDHLGNGVFLESVSTTANELLINVYTALPGDANGNGVVDGVDFTIWNLFKFQSGTDWTTGDFNGDGLTDGIDFTIWNQFKFTAADVVVPEPTLATMALAILISLSLCRRAS